MGDNNISKPIEVYSKEYSRLLEKAIALAYATKNVPVVFTSGFIAYTPFAGGESDKNF